MCARLRPWIVICGVSHVHWAVPQPVMQSHCDYHGATWHVPPVLHSLSSPYCSSLPQSLSRSLPLSVPPLPPSLPLCASLQSVSPQTPFDSSIPRPHAGIRTTDAPTMVGTARHGMAWHGTAWHGTAWQGSALLCITAHRTASRSLRVVETSGGV